MTMWERMPRAWRICTEEAWHAFVQGSIPVGAVVTDGGGQVIARARNRTAEPGRGPNEVGRHRLAHAELNALLRVDSRPAQGETYSLYTALEPCPLCMGALYMSGVTRLYYGARDGHAGSTNLLNKTPYLGLKPVTVHGPCLELEALYQTLHLAYGMGASPGFHRRLVEYLVRLYPNSGRLSRKLLNEGFFVRAIEEGFTAQELVSAMAERLEPEVLEADHSLSPWELEA